MKTKYKPIPIHTTKLYSITAHIPVFQGYLYDKWSRPIIHIKDYMGHEQIETDLKTGKKEIYKYEA